MKKILIFSVLLVIACISIFFQMIYCPECGTYINAEKLDYRPETYVEITQSDLIQYPYVQKVINNPESDIKVPDDSDSTHEFMKMLWENNRTQNIEIGSEYYRIRMISAD